MPRSDDNAPRYIDAEIVGQELLPVRYQLRELRTQLTQQILDATAEEISAEVRHQQNRRFIARTDELTFEISQRSLRNPDGAEILNDIGRQLISRDLRRHLGGG